MKKHFRFPLSLSVALVMVACQAIPIFTNAPTLVPTITSTPLSVEIMDAKGVIMRLVPAGDFTMGSDSDDDHRNSAHTVYLDSFYMDIYEVTNARYEECVTAGVCAPPHQTKSEFRPSYFGDSQYNDFPAVYVNWYMARTYCEVWRGARLPTEAEWEKAARGTAERTYPWGEDISCNQANYDSCVGETSEVGSYENGISPYGFYDMAGNVFEWVSSINRSYPYNSADGREELTGNSSRVIRGGGWSHATHDVQVFYRSWIGPNYSESVIGFRCVSGVTP